MELKSENSNRRLVTVEEVSEKIAMGPFGSSIRVKTFVPDGVPIISGQHLHGIRIDDSPGFNFISHEHAQRLLNANVKRGDVIFTHAGNIGQVAYIPEKSRFDRYVISQRQFYMRYDCSKIIPEYVTLYFTSPEGQHQLLSNASQVGVLILLYWGLIVKYREKRKANSPEEKLRQLAPDIIEICALLDLEALSKEELEHLARKTNQISAQLWSLGAKDPRDFSRPNMSFPDDLKSVRSMYDDLAAYSVSGDIKSAGNLGRLVRAKPV